MTSEETNQTELPESVEFRDPEHVPGGPQETRMPIIEYPRELRLIRSAIALATGFAVAYVLRLPEGEPVPTAEGPEIS